MRTLVIASAAVTLMAGGDAAAQRVVGHGPGVSPHVDVHPAQGAYRPAPVVHGRSHWGSTVGGRWWGGANAPGGWNAYRRPYRGWALPTYWNSPRFYIGDWSAYGLGRPPGGYNWVRYYDDAVLVDGHGSVYDTSEGIDWDRDADGYDGVDTRVYASPVERGHAYERGYRERSDGIGGAVVGGVVGGVAGNVIAGRGDRLGGTLVGAGVGAAAGYAIDRSAGRPPAPPPATGYGASYAAPGYDADAPYARGYGRGAVPPVAPRHAPPPPRDYGPDAGYDSPPPPPPPPNWVSDDGRTRVVTTTGGGYAAGGYYYPGSSTTTIVVQQQPAVTTTTTEIYEDSVTYARPKANKVYRTKLRRRTPACHCR